MEAMVKYRVPFAIASAAAVLLFSAYCLFYKLGNEAFVDYDEATYAQVTHESLEQGNLSGLTFLNSPYFRKPPLLFWMTTASQQVFEDVEFAVRFPSALAAFATILLVALICIEAGAGMFAAICASAILATTSAWMEFARDVRFDNLVACFCVAAFYAVIRARRDKRWFLAVGIALALAILSKNVLAVFGGISVLLFLVFEERFGADVRSRYLWYGVGIFFLITVPWHLYMTLTYGSAFWHSYLGTEVFERARVNLFPGGTNPTNLEYLAYLTKNVAPWSQAFVLSVLALPLFLRRAAKPIRSVLMAAFVTSLFVFALAFTAHTKAFGYLIPLYPFMALVIALVGREAWLAASVRRHAPAVLATLSVLLLILFFRAAAFTRYEALHLDPYYGWEIGQAAEERDIGRIIRAAPNPQVYTYGGYDQLGTIYYYSALPDTPQPYILLWSASSTPSATSSVFILATSSLNSLATSFPDYRFVQTYAGKFVSLFSVTAAR